MSTQPITVELRKNVSLVIGSFSFSQTSKFHSELRVVAVNAGLGWRPPKHRGQGPAGVTKTLGWLVRHGFTLASRERLSAYAPPVKQAIRERWFTCDTARLNRFYRMEYERN